MSTYKRHTCKNDYSSEKYFSIGGVLTLYSPAGVSTAGLGGPGRKCLFCSDKVKQTDKYAYSIFYVLINEVTYGIMLLIE